METKQNWEYVGLVINNDETCSEICNEVYHNLKDNIYGFRKVDLFTKILSIKSSRVLKSKLLDEINEKFPKSAQKNLLGIIGHGRYHHFTYGLCKLADRRSNEYCYVHIDHHCDSWRTNFDKKYEDVNCGNFVPYILEETNAKGALFLGTDLDGDIKESKYHNSFKTIKRKKGKFLTEKISGLFNKNKLERLIQSIDSDDIYLSIDLDVMDQGEVLTGYDRGNLKKEGLFEAIKMLKEKKRIIGADIVGYSNESETIRSEIKRSNKVTASLYDFDSIFSDKILIKEYGYYINKLKERSTKLYLDLAELITK